MAVSIKSGQVVGLEGVPIDVEVDLSQGLHRYSLVGLPDKAVDEARERISAAIKNSGLRPPHKKNQRVTINLAPADLRKEGPLFDLPIALAYVLASKQAAFVADKKMSLQDAQKVLAFLKELNAIFGFFSFDKAVAQGLAQDIMALIEKREAARKSKDFAQADGIRAELAAKGIELLDTPEGVKWKKIEK